jgi:ribonuclease HII
LKKIDFLILDGNFGINGINIMQRSIVKGDEKVMSCALASIIAKVERDKLMVKYHKKYPNYGFDRHKGYGTKLHYKMLTKFGPSIIHRRSFNLYG